MKKIVVIIALCLIVATCLFACDRPAQNTEDNKYEIKIDYSEEKLSCEQKTTVINTYKEGIEEYVFLLSPNAYSEEAVNKAYVKKLPSYGSITISEVKLNGENAEFSVDEDGYYMSVKTIPQALDAKSEIEMKYEVVLPECNLRLGKSNGYINVSNFYPQLAVYGEEGFRKDRFFYIGDPILSDIADFSVTINLPETLVVACPGEVTESISDGVKTITAQCDDFRDFAFVANENYTVKTLESDGVTIKYYSVKGNDYTSLAADVIKTFSEAYCKYPYGDYVIAETSFSPDGMEFSGMSFVADDTDNATQTIIHETVHQWFYNVVGSDNIESPYLDEGLTTFMTEYYYVLRDEKEKFDEGMKKISDAYLSYERLQKMRGEKGDLSLNKSIYDYSEYGYSMLVYYKTAMMFNNLYETAGKARFDKAIKNYVEDNYMKRADVDSLTASFAKAMKCDVKGLIDGWCGGSVTTAKFA